MVCVQEEGRRLLQRAETAEGQVHHLESEKLNLSTKSADTQQHPQALQTQLEVSEILALNLHALSHPCIYSLKPICICQHDLIRRYAG